MRPRKQRYERYDLQDSIWSQNPTQADLAALLGMTKDRVEALIDSKERYISRRLQEINGKLRKLTVPVGRLRTVHEKLKFQLNKIKHPDYMFSPRKNRGQRDNADVHSSGIQIVKLDIKQFYPKTTDEDIWRWAFFGMGIYKDVAGMFTKLIAIDGRMPFGSPISPVLTALIHRPMFDQVAEVCDQSDLKMSLWVDDLTISGKEVSGFVIGQIRDIIRDGGFSTHKIERFHGNNPTYITGVPVSDGRVLAPISLHNRLKAGHQLLHSAKSDADRAGAIDNLLSMYGTYRYHVGAATAEGRKAADRMHALKQRRLKLKIVQITEAENKSEVLKLGHGDFLPWE